MSSKLIYLSLDFTLSDDKIDSLMQLYQPLFNHPAASLYLTLYTQAKYEPSISSRELIHKLHVHIDELGLLREELERFSLLRTFENGQNLCCELLEPLSPAKFLEHVTFGRLYAIVHGNDAFVNASNRYYNAQMNIDRTHEISKSFDLSRLEMWSEEHEEIYSNYKPSETKNAFDAEQFFNSWSNAMFPSDMRTNEVKQIISEVGTIYNLSYPEMKAKILEASNISTRTFNRTKFITLIERELGRQSIESVENPYELDPLSFLAYKQSNDYIVDANKNLIRSLQQNFNFSGQIINVLIEYVLNTNNQNLTRNYVEAIAATWQRSGVDTVEKAKAMTQFKEKTNKPTYQKSNRPKAEAIQPSYNNEDDSNESGTKISSEEPFDLEKWYEAQNREDPS